jgi:peptidoglycan/xylan/chitin deacetylase (PgdA/CDA1 family)
MVACRSAAGAAPDTNLDRPAYLIAVQRYREAAELLQYAPKPYTLQTLCSRATLLLYVERPAQASEEFLLIRARTPEDESLADYGQALCAMMESRLSDADADLSRCMAGSDYAHHRLQIDLARAVLASAKGNNTVADSLCATIDSPLASEIVAMDQFEQSPTSAASMSILRLEPWSLPGGVPRVTEMAGLRAVGAFDRTAGARLLDPCIAGSPDADAIFSMLEQSATAAAVPATHVSGTVTLAPSDAAYSAPGTIVTYYVDGSLVAVATGGSLAYRWDTTSCENGPHAVMIEISGPSGAKLDQTKQYLVANTAKPLGAAAPVQVAPLDDADQIAVTDAWQLLTLQSSYKAAEMILSRAAAQRGDAAGALKHYANAAAIDPAYVDNIRQITDAYGGREPLLYPLPPGSSGVEQYATANSPHPHSSLGIWRGSPAIKEVALTFDDGPSPTDTPPLLDELDASNTPATFFVVGTRAEAAPDIIRRMHDMGDEVEDHSFTHPNLDQAIPLHIYEEILRNAVIVQALTGIWPHFLRPPGGQTNPHVLEAATACGMAGAFWTVDVLPAEDSGSPSNVVRLVMKHVIPGAVILMHDAPYATTHAIPELTAELRAHGYKLVTLLQLARDAAPNAS